MFGEKTMGSPFNVYFPGKTSVVATDGTLKWEEMQSRHYAVKAGDSVTDEVPLRTFENQQYHIQVYGPNGFMREFKGDHTDPGFQLACDYQQDRLHRNKMSGNVELNMQNLDKGKQYELTITDNAYRNKPKTIWLTDKNVSTILDLKSSYGWYDFSVKIKGYPSFEQRFAGRVETGAHSFSDPFMGRV